MTIRFGEWTIGLNGEGAPDRELIGGKAWSVARMQALGLNVPSAVVITTQACAAFTAGQATPSGLDDEIAAGVAWLEERTGRRFGADFDSFSASVDLKGKISDLPPANLFRS